MAKEIYISSTPHETRLAVVEEDQLAEIYYERENEYTLAGSIYKGKVTRVLPGMQSAFVDIGLERDAFLYVTDFVEEQEDGEEYTPLPQSQSQAQQSRGGQQASQSEPDEKRANESQRESASEGEQGEGGMRRWRGRRGRRRGRGGQQRRPEAAAGVPEESVNEPGLQVEPLNEYAVEETAFEEAEQVENVYAHSEPAQVEVEPVHAHREHAPAHIERHSEPANEALVLPGESLSKYRRGQASEIKTPVAETAKPAAPAPKPTFQPSTMVTGPIEWTGSGLLPGESLSRHRNKSAEPVHIENTVVEAAPVDETHSEPLTQSIEAVSSPAAEAGSLHEHPLTQHPLHEHPIAAPEVVVAPENDEPEKNSASYRFDPTAPSTYRQSFTAEPEPEIIEPAPMAGVTPAAEPEPAVESKPEVFFDEAVPLVQPHPHTHENSSLAAEVIPQEPEVDTESFDEEAEGQESHIFNPGDGNLEEEMIDEEEHETLFAHAPADDEEYDDLVEETLDVQMDSGLLSEFVRDQHIDRRTGNDEESGEHAVLDEEFADEEFESNGIELEEVSDEEETQDELDNADAARPQHGQHRHQRRGMRGQRGQRGNDRGRMRRATAQTTNLPAITELLKPNQEILVQIAKEPIARKGARITSHIALPGRFLVFMPTVNHVGVSRKIASDSERQRLKHILLSEKGSASGGFIVRTAAASASEDDLRADIRFLLTLWAEIKQRADNAKPPALIYHDLSLVERVLRDQVTDNFSAIWVDSEQDYERVLRFLNRFEPSLVRRVKLYSKETPLFEQFGIQEEINKALRSKVWLKSGGSIVINQTEALVAIDINTGKYVGKTARLEDTILKTNLDAIPEIVRQIRLRDLGGIIVIDFIDMDERKNRNKVMQALEEELKSDRAPSKVLQFNDFGLVAITRKRVKQSLERTLSTPCYVCTGTGMVKGPVTVCNEIYIELRKMHRQLDRGDILLRVHPEVVKQLKAGNGRWLNEMEEISGKTIIVKSDPALHPEQFDIH